MLPDMTWMTPTLNPGIKMIFSLTLINTKTASEVMRILELITKEKFNYLDTSSSSCSRYKECMETCKDNLYADNCKDVKHFFCRFS